MSEDKLWLELRYGNRYTWHSAIAAYHPALDRWDIIPCPGKPENTYGLGQPVFLGGEAESGLYFQPFCGAVYISQWNEPLRKVELKTRHWETLPVPIVKPTQLFAINGHLYGASEETIFEILEAGQSTRLLAGCRRRPIASRLDLLETFSDAMLVPGPANILRAIIADTVFAWDGHNWRDDLAIHGARAHAVFGDATLFRDTRPPRLWMVPHSQTHAELCWQDQRTSAYAASSVERPTNSNGMSGDFPRPTWQGPPHLSLAATAVGTLNSNLYFASTHIQKSNVIAELTCLDRSLSNPLIIRLKLGEDLGSLLSDESHPFQLTTYAHLRPWMDFTSGALLLGHGRWSGVWTIPLPAMDTAFAAEKQLQRRNKSKHLQRPE